MTARLVGMIARDWAVFDGMMSSQGVDPLELPPDRFISAIYAYAVNNGDKDEVAKFDRKLWMPPKGVAPVAGSPWSPEAETEAFNQLAAVFGTA